MGSNPTFSANQYSIHEVYRLFILYRSYRCSYPLTLLDVKETHLTVSHSPTIKNRRAISCGGGVLFWARPFFLFCQLKRMEDSNKGFCFDFYQFIETLWMFRRNRSSMSCIILALTAPSLASLNRSTPYNESVKLAV